LRITEQLIPWTFLVFLKHRLVFERIALAGWRYIVCNARHVGQNLFFWIKVPRGVLAADFGNKGWTAAMYRVPIDLGEERVAFDVASIIRMNVTTWRVTGALLPLIPDDDSLAAAVELVVIVPIPLMSKTVTSMLQKSQIKSVPSRLIG